MKKNVRQNAIKRLALSLPIACALALPQGAYADESQNCPPGSWFCGNTQPAPAGNPNSLPVLPAEEKAMAPMPVAATTPPPPPPQQPPPPPPPSAFYQGQQPTIVVVRQAPPPPPPYARPRYYVVRRTRPPTEWGLNLHAGGLLLGAGRHHEAGMALAGVGFRFRPVPVFALEADLDFAGGRDYNDFRRFETGVSVNGLFFLNPRDMTQVYFVGGFGWSSAHVTDDSSPYYDVKYTYDYFGVQGGVGLEFRLSPSVALNVDVRGIVRSRIDGDRDIYPEFTDSNGRTTNTSAAGLVRGGLTVYW